MGIKIHTVLVLFFCLSCVVVFSQKQDRKVVKANTEYEEFSFVKARKWYKKAIEKGGKSNEIYARLGDTYFFNSDYSNALKWYTKLMENGTVMAPVYALRYSICLRANNEHEQSFAVMIDYYSKTGKIEEAKKWNPKEYLVDIKEQSGRYGGVVGARINSNLSDFGVVLVPNSEAFKQALEIKNFEKVEKARILRLNAARRRKADGYKPELQRSGELAEDTAVSAKKFEKLPKYKEVIYATAKDSGAVIKRKHNWNNKPYLKLYTAQISEEGMLINEKKIAGDINTTYHQSTPAITKDGLTMYFTRLVPYEEKDQDKSKQKSIISQLKVFEAKKINNKWVTIKMLPYPINIEGTSSAHPALSPNDDLLYFVSNREKEMNDTDLYVVSRKERGGFDGKAESLGEEINTLSRETFPYVDGNGILYFASDGHPGMGGLDVFASLKDPEGKRLVINVGEPINSASDDFAFVIDSDSRKGFFSSNREGGVGDDDVYKFSENKKIVVPFKLDPEYFGTIKNSKTGILVSGVKITVYNDRNEIIKTMTTDESGTYAVDLSPLKNYSFEFEKDGYQIDKVFVEGQEISAKKEMQVTLFNELTVTVDGKVVHLKEGDDLTDKLKLKPIYFNYGGYDIRKSSKIELDKIIDLIKTRPSLSIEVRSHSDSRGKDDYNLKLSKSRAKTTIDYIIAHSQISSDRIWGEGYGETQLINTCSNGVKCTPAEHELNRRSEFILVVKK